MDKITLVLVDDAGNESTHELDIIAVVEHDSKQFMVVSEEENMNVLMLEERDNELGVSLASDEDAEAVYAILEPKCKEMEKQSQAPETQSIE